VSRPRRATTVGTRARLGSRGETRGVRVPPPACTSGHRHLRHHDVIGRSARENTPENIHTGNGVAHPGGLGHWGDLHGRVRGLPQVDERYHRMEAIGCLAAMLREAAA
jgi:hypothetical protein